MESLQNFGAVILAGGQSRRMGQCKALLTLSGETMVSRLYRQLDGFPERLISANDPLVAQGLSLQVIPDQMPGLGPLAGLHAALQATRKEALLCLPCDMPYFTADAAMALVEAFPEGCQAMVCRDTTGRLHPLCGIYAASALPVIQRRLTEGKLRMTELLEELSYVSYSNPNRIPDWMLTNVNTPDVFQQVCGQQTPEELLTTIKANPLLPSGRRSMPWMYLLSGSTWRAYTTE